MGGCRGKLGRPRCRPRWDTHLNSRSLLNWNSSLAARAAGSVKKCTNGQTKTIWLPFSGSHKKLVDKRICIKKKTKKKKLKAFAATYKTRFFDCCYYTPLWSVARGGKRNDCFPRNIFSDHYSLQTKALML